jgi:hypothetical protein
MADTSRPADPPRPVVDATEARQARTVRPMIWVLVIGTLLAAAALTLAWLWKAPGLSRPGSQETTASKAAAGAFHAPEPAAVVPQPGTDHTAPQPR